MVEIENLDNLRSEVSLKREWILAGNNTAFYDLHQLPFDSFYKSWHSLWNYIPVTPRLYSPIDIERIYRVAFHMVRFEKFRQ